MEGVRRFIERLESGEGVNNSRAVGKLRRGWQKRTKRGTKGRKRMGMVVGWEREEGVATKKKGQGEIWQWRENDGHSHRTVLRQE